MLARVGELAFGESYSVNNEPAEQPVQGVADRPRALAEAGSALTSHRGWRRDVFLQRVPAVGGGPKLSRNSPTMGNQDEAAGDRGVAHAAAVAA